MNREMHLCAWCRARAELHYFRATDEYICTQCADEYWQARAEREEPTDE